MRYITTVFALFSPVSYSNKSVGKKDPSSAAAIMMTKVSTATLCPVHPIVDKALNQLHRKNANKKTEEDNSRITDCISLVLRYVDNVLGDPKNTKFHIINCSKNIFSSRIGGLPGGFDLMASIGKMT